MPTMTLVNCCIESSVEGGGLSNDPCFGSSIVDRLLKSSKITEVRWNFAIVFKNMLLTIHRKKTNLFACKLIFVANA